MKDNYFLIQSRINPKMYHEIQNISFVSPNILDKKQNLSMDKPLCEHNIIRINIKKNSLFFYMLIPNNGNYCYALVGELDNDTMKIVKEYEKDIDINSIKFNIKEIESKLKDGKIYTIFFIKELMIKEPLIQKNLTSYNNIAYYLQKSGANEEAIYLLEKILKKFPQRTVAYYNLGDAYWAWGEKEKAINAYTTYIKQMSDKGKEKKIPLEVLKRARGNIDTKNTLNTYLEKTFPEYTLLKTKEADLDKDGVEDIIVVLQSKKKGEPYSTLDDAYGRKVVFVTFGKNDFKILSQNDFVVGCSTCGGAVGDPFRGISVKGNYISFEELYGACVKDFQVTTFKYSKKYKKWYLHKIGVESSYCNEEVNGAVKVETRIKTRKDFGIIAFGKYKN